MLYYAIFICLVLICKGEYFHQSPEQYKLSQGWQEPGLWRPRWILDRKFEATDEEDEYRDRIVLRLKSDRSIKLYTSDKRPKLEVFKPKNSFIERKRKLFETGNEERIDAVEELRKSVCNKKAEENLDGVWTWQEQPQLKSALVKIQTNEGKKGTFRHDIRCEWGKLDGYAAKFLKGKIHKYTFTDNGLPVGTEQVGTFTIRVSPHRPIISKEYVAFQ